MFPELLGFFFLITMLLYLQMLSIPSLASVQSRRGTVSTCLHVFIHLSLSLEPTAYQRKLPNFHLIHHFPTDSIPPLEDTSRNSSSSRTPLRPSSTSPTHAISPQIPIFIETSWTNQCTYLDDNMSIHRINHNLVLFKLERHLEISLQVFDSSRDFLDFGQELVAAGFGRLVDG